MKRLVILSGILALAAPFALAQSSTWVSDPNHSEVDFSVTHLSISKVHGRIGGVKATIQYDPTDIAKSSVNVTMDVTTIDTGVQPRDNDLKSTRFFDVANTPTATFTSTSVSKNGSNLTVAGNLTLRGVTKPVVLNVEGPTGPITDAKHHVHSGFSASTTLDRTAFGIGTTFPDAMISDQVQLTIEMDAIKQ